MASLYLTDGFKEDLLAVESDRVLEQVLSMVELLQTVPDMGSRNLPASIQQEFGDNARKIPVGPFDIVVRYREEDDVVVLAGLIHQRAAW